MAEKLYPSGADEIIKLSETIPNSSDFFLKFGKEGFEHLSKLYYSNIKMSTWWGLTQKDITISVRIGEEIQAGYFSWRSKARTKEIASLSLFGYECVFLTWEKNSTELFTENTLLGSVQMTDRRRFIVRGIDGFEFNLNYSAWPWQFSKCSWNNTSIPIPTNWPDVDGNFSENSMILIQQLPETQRNMIVSSLIWRNAIFGLSGY